MSPEYLKGRAAKSAAPTDKAKPSQEIRKKTATTVSTTAAPKVCFLLIDIKLDQLYNILFINHVLYLLIDR